MKIKWSIIERIKSFSLFLSSGLNFKFWLVCNWVLKVWWKKRDALNRKIHISLSNFMKLVENNHLIRLIFSPSFREIGWKMFIFYLWAISFFSSDHRVLEFKKLSVFTWRSCRPFIHYYWTNWKVEGFIFLQYPELYIETYVLIKVLYLETTLVESLNDYFLPGNAKNSFKTSFKKALLVQW